VGLKRNERNQFLTYVDDMNLLGDNIRVGTMKKNTETLLDAYKEDSLQVNVEKSKYTMLPRHQTAGKSHGMKVAKRSLMLLVSTDTD
jgi:hypothetical protein